MSHVEVSYFALHHEQRPLIIIFQCLVFSLPCLQDFHKNQKPHWRLFRSVLVYLRVLQRKMAKYLSATVAPVQIDVIVGHLEKPTLAEEYLVQTLTGVGVGVEEGAVQEADTLRVAEVHHLIMTVHLDAVLLCVVEAGHGPRIRAAVLHRLDGRLSTGVPLVAEAILGNLVASAEVRNLSALQKDSVI